MNSKRKLIISIGAVVLVILAAVIAISVVLAAQNVTVQSSVNITYTASGDIAGVITGEYKQHSSASPDYQPIGEAPFDGNEFDNASKTLNASVINVELTDDTDYVMFKFGFTNTNTSNAYKASLKYTDNFTSPYNKDENIIISYGADEYVNQGNTKPANYTSDECELGYIIINENTTSPVYYYVKIQLESKVSDAEFSGAFKWSLSPNT